MMFTPAKLNKQKAEHNHGPLEYTVCGSAVHTGRSEVKIWLYLAYIDTIEIVGVII